MNFTKKILLTFSLLLALAVSASAQKPFVVNLWQNGAPNDNGDVADTATVKVFLPRKEEATGRAVVICPGGGYQHLAMNHEGYDWAPFFNNMGIAAIVLKYRMPHGNCDVPIADAEGWNNGVFGWRTSCFHHCHSFKRRRKARLPDSLLPRHHHATRHYPQGQPRQFPRKGCKEKGREAIQQRRTGVKSHATCLHRPLRRRPCRVAGKRSELLH